MTRYYHRARRNQAGSKPPTIGAGSPKSESPETTYTAAFTSPAPGGGVGTKGFGHSPSVYPGAVVEPGPGGGAAAGADTGATTSEGPPPCPEGQVWASYLDATGREIYAPYCRPLDSPCPVIVGPLGYTWTVEATDPGSVTCTQSWTGSGTEAGEGEGDWSDHIPDQLPGDLSDFLGEKEIDWTKYALPLGLFALVVGGGFLLMRRRG